MTDTETDSFIREVSEEVRQDRMYRLWKRYAPFVIGGIVAIVAGAALWNWLQHQEREAARERGALFLAAGSDAEAKAAVVENTEGAAAAIAQLQLARAQADGGSPLDAIATYRQVASNSGLKRAYTDLAALEAARLEAPTLALEKAEGLLSPLAAEDAPYRPLALELRAALRLNAGDAAGAQADLEAVLETPGLTQGLSARARQMLAIIEGSAGHAE